MMDEIPCYSMLNVKDDLLQKLDVARRGLNYTGATHVPERCHNISWAAYTAKGQLSCHLDDMCAPLHIGGAPGVSCVHQEHAPRRNGCPVAGGVWVSVTCDRALHRADSPEKLQTELQAWSWCLSHVQCTPA